jgi:glycosyltransferase involved in cell wall biosynthesis
LLVSSSKPRLVFVSPVFLFPNDAGGKIRTTNILRGLKGGAFHVTLLSAATAEQARRWSKEIDGACDEFIGWDPAAARPMWLRAFDLLGRSTCFTHNVEAEIFARHAKQARGPLRRWLWTSQHAKMERFEGAALRRFDSVIAVSERDARFFTDAYQVAASHAIPTGVDLDFFSYQAPPAVDAATPPTVVFTGSMDWAANIDGMQFFLNQVWPRVLAARPDARFVVVGRNPPPSLLALARNTSNVEFTGFVDDVRPYVHAAHAFVIPLLVGGGTRIKAFEAMAMGCPVVSTAIGIEGLEAQRDVHYLERDDPAAMAAAVLDLLNDTALRNDLAQRARQLVEDRFGHEKAARVFEEICLRTLAAPAPAQAAA